MAILQRALPVAMLLFVLSSMLAMGFGLTVAQIIAPLRNGRLVASSLLANFVLMPLAALALAKLLRLDEAFGVGLLLLGAAGAPFLPKLDPDRQGTWRRSRWPDGVAHGHHGRVSPPRVAGLAAGRLGRSGGDRPVAVLADAAALAGALVVNAKLPGFAARAKVVCDRLSGLGLILVVLLQIVVNFSNVLSVFGTRAILAGLLFIAVGYGVGWLLGGPAADTRSVLGLGTAQRNIAALVVGSQSFSDPKVVVMVVVVAMASLLSLMPLSRMLAKAA